MVDGAVIKSRPVREQLRSPWLVLVLIALTVLFSAGCGLLGFGEGLCKKRADYENALVREALGPAVSRAGLAEAMEDQNDCDSSTYGSEVSILAGDVEPKEIVAAFENTGWSSKRASDRSRDCVARCEAYDLTKKFGERVVGVSLEGPLKYGGVEILASAADDCWDDKGYRCPDG